MNFNNSRVLVVIVTYNRRKLLEKLLASLKDQSKSIKGILLFDNNSSDDTIDFLTDSNFIESNIENEKLFTNIGKINKYYFRSSSNLGGSGGFAKALQLASSLDYDYVWIMDDDVIPDVHCLENLLNAIKEHQVEAAIPNRNSINFKDSPVVKFDLNSVFKYFSSKRKTRIDPPFEEDYYYVQTFAFEGPLISMKTIRKVGIPNADYFILYDDTDYAQRILKYTKIIYIVNAHLFRQLPFKRNTKSSQLGWKDYYSIRNNMYFDKKYGKNFAVRKISPQLMFAHLVISTIFKGHIKSNMPIIIKAWKDATLNKMGKGIKNSN